MITTLLMMMHNIAFAGDWTVMGEWPIASSLGPKDPFLLHSGMIVSRCRIGPNGPTADGEYTLPYLGYCLATDANKSWTTSDSRFIFVSSDILTDSNTNEDYVTITLEFHPTLDSSGQWMAWPQPLPAYVEASEAFGPYTHSVVVVLQDDDYPVRAEMPPVTPAVPLTTTSVINVPAAWAGMAKQKYIQAPNGTYSGASANDYVKMITTPNMFGVDVQGTLCHVLDGDQSAGDKDWLQVFARQNVPAGTYYCKVVKNGTVIYKPVQVTH